VSSLDLSGIWVPLVTPFAHGRVDHDALRRVAGHCAAGGVAGFVACGSTGEPWALDDAEQAAVLASVRTAGRPVLMGVAGAHAGQVRERLLRFADAGADGFLVPAPYYVRPSQAGLLTWFGALADASPCPIVLYDIPYRTGVRIEPDTVLALAAHPRIVGLKDCGGDAAGTQRLIASRALRVMCGEDAQILATLAAGGHGAIAASAHLRPELFVALHRAVSADRTRAPGRCQAEGDRGAHPAEARRLAQALAPLVALLFAEPNPAPLKALLAQLGLVRNELRPPLVPASRALVERLVATWEDVARISA
jgi:4-hydroxy-tetrahydrodipicolinate synthase